jgi:Na+-driven multidrug efflux pump
MRQIARRRVKHDRVEPLHSPSERSPGPVVVAAAAVAFVVCVTNFALGEAGAGVAAAIVGLLAFGAGLAWLAMDRRRIRDAERAWPVNRAAR